MQRGKMSATIEDVAKHSGVSTATVSRALRGLPNVSPATRAIVIKTAEALNYAISPQVSRMASGRKVIGLVRPLADQWFYAKAAFTAEIVLTTAGYDVVRYSVDNTQVQSQLVSQLISRNLVDGFIFSTLALTEENILALKQSNLPVVTIETSTKEFSSIRIDNVLAGKLATRHLINLGHRRIGIITGLNDDPLHFSAPQARTAGYWEALKEGGIEARSEYEVQGNYSYEGGAEAMKHLFSLHNPPTAIFSLSDEMAIGALKVVRDMNLRIPENISIIGFDDNEVSEYIGLTTIRQPVADYGEIAAKLIIDQIEANSDGKPHHVECPIELVLRSTTGPSPQR